MHAPFKTEDDADDFQADENRSIYEEGLAEARDLDRQEDEMNNSNKKTQVAAVLQDIALEQAVENILDKIDPPLTESQREALGRYL
jgi:hypothetical protein